MAAKQVQSFRSIGRKRNKGENPSIQELVPIKKMIRGNVVKKWPVSLFFESHDKKYQRSQCQRAISGYATF